MHATIRNLSQKEIELLQARMNNSRYSVVDAREKIELVRARMQSNSRYSVVDAREKVELVRARMDI